MHTTVYIAAVLFLDWVANNYKLRTKISIETKAFMNEVLQIKSYEVLHQAKKPNWEIFSISNIPQSAYTYLVSNT